MIAYIHWVMPSATWVSKSSEKRHFRTPAPPRVSIRSQYSFEYIVLTKSLLTSSPTTISRKPFLSFRRQLSRQTWSIPRYSIIRPLSSTCKLALWIIAEAGIAPLCSIWRKKIPQVAQTFLGCPQNVPSTYPKCVYVITGTSRGLTTITNFYGVSPQRPLNVSKSPHIHPGD